MPAKLEYEYMSQWTENELGLLRHTRTYDEYVGAGGVRSYNSWETKRRRAEKDELQDLERDESDLIEWDATEKEEKERFSKASAAIERPNLGETREFPDVITWNPAFFDLETTNLKANFGRILCASVADMYGNVRTFRIDEKPWKRERRRDDIALAVGLRDYLEQFDVLVGWYSKMFDIPYLNTRLLIGNERPIREMMHFDPIWKAKKGSLALHSARLDAVAKTFRLPTQKTGLDPEIWNDAADGDREAMDYVVEHCEADTLVLRQAFHILKTLAPSIHR